MTQPDPLSWQNYWAQGAVTSCAGAFSDNYSGVIRTLWERRFASMVDGSRILDIGTGNGAIALLAAAVARQQDRSFIIDAIDLAKIDPASDLRGESRQLLVDIRFHPSTDICNCGFDNDSVDLVTGNFALEYCDQTRAINEMTRITAPAGQHLFVIHHSDSVIVQTAAQELAHIESLLNKQSVLQKAIELINRIGDVSIKQRQQLSGDSGIEQCRLAFNNAARQTSKVIAESDHPEILRTALGRVSEAYRLSQTQNQEVALEHLQQTRQELIDNASRLSGLRHNAASPSDIERLTHLYHQNGIQDVCIDTLHEATAGLIAWVVRARAT